MNDTLRFVVVLSTMFGSSACFATSLLAAYHDQPLIGIYLLLMSKLLWQVGEELVPSEYRRRRND